MKTKFKQTEIGMIPEEWEVKLLGDEIELCYGKGLTESKRVDGKFPVFGSNGIVDFHNQFLVQGPGIIIGRKGSVGEIKFSKDNFWPIDTTYFIKLKKRGNIRFWYYFLLTLKLNKMNSHSAVPGLNREQVYELLKEIPEYEEQSAIAKILSDLDSKIELNQQMNKTLEAIGQAIFKRWFIDFEFPNEKGKPYKSSGGEMIFNEELGKDIPKGWKVGSLGDYINFIKGKKPFETSEEFKVGYLPQILIENLDGRQPVYANTEKMVIVEETEPIMVMDGASSGRIEIGHCGILGSTLAKVIVKNKLLTNSYLLHFLKIYQKDINQNTTGTSIPHTDKEKIIRYGLVLPNKRLLELFDEFAIKILYKIIKNKEEIQNLSQIRDSLLPKLMSGKIRVPVEIRT